MQLRNKVYAVKITQTAQNVWCSLLLTTLTISILSHSDFHCLYMHPFLVFLFLFFNLRADILSSSSCWRKFWMALNITQTLWLAILSFNCKEKLFFKLKQWRRRPANALIAKRDKVLAGDRKLLVINEYRQIIFGQNEMLFTHLIIYFELVPPFFSSVVFTRAFLRILSSFVDRNGTVTTQKTETDAFKCGLLEKFKF